MSIATVEYISDRMPEQIIDRKKPVSQDDLRRLSSLSRAIINSVFEKDVIILLFQGPLNVTPIITSLYAKESHQDVVVGLPKANFNETYKKYTKEYFSLQYRAIKDSVTTHSMFFYMDLAWCKGVVSSENELEHLDIEVNPVLGSLRFKQLFREWMGRKINDGSIYQNSKIVFIPMESSIPAGILNEMDASFSSCIEKVNLHPGFIILESINERRFNFDDLVELITISKEKNKKLLLHFSWPYLRGLDEFLSRDEIKNHNSIAIYHLGKQYCIKNRPIDSIKPPAKLLPLSVEGVLWDGVYYPKQDEKSKSLILLPQVTSQLAEVNIESLKTFDYFTDRDVKTIRSLLDMEKVSNDFNRFLMLFPTVIDTFMLPSETMIETDLGGGNWRHLSIDHRLKHLEPGLKSVNAFSSLCDDMEKCRDLSYEINGLHTYMATGKRTLLQAYIIESIQNLFIAIKNGCKDQVLSQTFVIAHLHPYLKGISRFNSSIEYMSNSLNEVIRNVDRPRLIRDGDALLLKIGEQRQIVFENGKLFTPVLTISSKNGRLYPVRSKIIHSDDGVEIKITIDINLEYIEINNTDILNEKDATNIDIYYAKVRPDGFYNEITMTEVDAYVSGSSSKIMALIKNVSFSGGIPSILEHRIEIRSEILNIGVISKLPREQVVESKLLVPGPLPFGTVQDAEIVITQGHDALLQPFKEIAIFAYPGNNLSAVLRQIQIAKDLVSVSDNDLSKADLNFSLRHMKNTRLEKMPQITTSMPDAEKDKAVDENVVDVIFRKDMIENAGSYGNEENVTIELSDIWKKIPKHEHINVIYSPNLGVYSQKGIINLKARFDDGHVEPIEFTKGTLIRKKMDDQYVISPVDEINVNEIIFYMGASEHKSIDNYLLKEYAEDQDMSLEQILEPFTCLKTFYETISTIDSTTKDATTHMNRLYWLSELQRESLFHFIKSALCDDIDINEITGLMDDNFIWTSNLDAEQLISIFGRGRGGMTYNKLYDIAKSMGMTLIRDSFRSVCSSSINNQNHYYFKKAVNMLAIGRLLGHQGIIDDYKAINERGERIRVVLQIIGLSISRVAAGKGDPFNEMDRRVEKGMIKCTIIDKIVKE